VSQYLDNRETEIFLQQREILASVAAPSRVVFDVGANIGQSIERYRALWPDARIHSFEPNPAAFATLSDKYRDMHDVALHPVALADTRGESPFHVTRIPEMSSLLEPEGWLRAMSPGGKYDFSTIRIPVDTLDHFCSERGIAHIDILKIDVQGAELKVLHGGSRMLSEGRIGMLYLEANLAETYVDQTTLSGMLNFLEPLGYRIWNILPFVYTCANRAWTANVLFVGASLVERVESAARARAALPPTGNNK